MRKRSFLIILLLFVTMPVFANSLNLEKEVTEFQLTNGMKWLLVRRPQAPVFSAIIQVKVGGIDESIGKTGLAHMLEHMAFKGTDKISSDELWNAFMTNGAAQLNAYTSKDVTGYYASMPTSKLELWLYLNSEMIRHSVTRDFFKERSVVLEERRNSIENNPKGKMFDTLLDIAFEKSPYKWPTIGRGEDVATLTPEDLMAFKKRYYMPQRMVGSIVGDIDIEKTKVLIEKYFGVIPSGKATDEKFPQEEAQKSEKSAKIKFDASPSMVMAYHKPTLPNHDDYVFDVMLYILCEGESSRMKRSLVLDKKLVQSFDCDPSTPGARLNNLFIIMADPMGGHSVSEVEDAIEKELNGLKTSPVTEDELKKAKNNAYKDFVFDLITNEGLAQSLAYFQVETGNWRYVVDHIKVLDKIGQKDVMDTAQKYFTNENKTVVEISR